MSYTNGLDKPDLYFNTKLYTGDDTNNRQISLDWSPDLTWIKARNIAYGHVWYDRVRGIGKTISSFLANSEDTNANGWSNSGCTTNSFTVDRGSNETLNESGRPMVAWNWLAGGTGVSNTDGSITSTVSANTTSGFSIVTYTGNITSGATVGHGLGVTPAVIIVKKRSAADGWAVYHHKNTSAPETDHLRLDTTDATLDNLGEWNDTAPTSSFFSIGNSGRTNDNGATYIAYCFAEKKGFSKFGSFIGNGSSDGPYIHLGFKPAWVMIKGADNSAGATPDWRIRDNKRSTYNTVQDVLYANSSSATITEDDHDFLSNGFKVRTSGAENNYSGDRYIYMAFAENPFVTSTGVPTCAR